MKLQVQQLVKSYGAKRALDGLSFELKEGEFTALLGPNGAGKSTLFQLLTGLFVPDSGSILINGAPLRESPSKALAQMGVVFQQQALDLDLSVERNLLFQAALHGMNASAAKPRIAQLLNEFGLSKEAMTPTRALSGGTKRKIELMRALLHKPQLLLADEATVGLDPASRNEMMQRVKSLCAEQGVAVLWATHLVHEAESADRVLVLHQGKLLSEGTPAHVRDQLGGESLEAAFVKATAAKSARA
jgi:ABC-2 type transport system ATP-binding protein